MARRTLLDFFADLALIDASFISHDDGYRTRRSTYREIAADSRAVADRLCREGIVTGDKVLIWSENRPEWIALLWGCLLEGVIVVPVDYRSSAELTLRIAAIVDAKAVIAGDVVPTFQSDRPVWRIAEVAVPTDSVRERSLIESRHERRSIETKPEDVAEIIFTSGATAEPKGVVLTHRNILANIVPIERELTKYRRYVSLVSPIRFLNLLPLSHMFGQSLATFVPPLLQSEVFFMRSYAPQDIIERVHASRISVLVCVPKILEVLRDHVTRVAPEVTRPSPAGTHWVRRWWIYRRVHRMFGLKF